MNDTDVVGGVVNVGVGDERRRVSERTSSAGEEARRFRDAKSGDDIARAGCTCSAKLNVLENASTSVVTCEMSVAQIYVSLL